MTGNQQTAIHLARQILADERGAIDLKDPEWELLLLAAGLNNVNARPSMVALRVLADSTTQSGYFFKTHRPQPRGMSSPWEKDGQQQLEPQSDAPGDIPQAEPASGPAGVIAEIVYGLSIYGP